MCIIQHTLQVKYSPLKTSCYRTPAFLLFFRVISLFVLFFWARASLSAVTNVSVSPYYVEQALSPLIKNGEPVKGERTWYNEHVSGICSSSFNEKGNLLATTSVGKPIELWSISQRKLATTFIGSTENQSAFVDLSADGNLIAFSMDGRVELRDIKQRSLLFSIPVLDSGLSALSKNGHYLASAIDGKRIDLWDTKKQQRIHSFTGNQYMVTALKISGDGRYLVSANKSGLIKVWDIIEKRFMYELDEHKKPVTSLIFSVDSKRFVTIDTSGATRIWDIEKAERLHQLAQPVLALKTIAKSAAKSQSKLADDAGKAFSTAVAISPDGRQLLRVLNDVVSDRVYADMFDMLTGKRLFTIKSLTTPVNGLAFLSDNRSVVFSLTNKIVKLFDSSSQRFVDTFGGQLLKARQTAVSPDGSVIAVGTMDGVIQLWDAQKKSLLYSLKGHQESIEHIAFSADAQFILAGDNYGYVMLWDLKDKHVVWSFKAHKKGSTVFAMSPDNLFLLTSTTESSVMTLWDMKSRSSIYKFRGHHAGITDIRYTDDGKMIVSSSNDGSVKLWDVVSRKVLHSFTSGSRNKKFTSLAISRDGKYLAAGVNASGNDVHSIEIWAFDGLTQHYRLDKHVKKVTAVQFSPDGRQLVSASEDGSIKVWDVQDGTLLANLNKKAVIGKTPVPVHSVAFATNGKEVVSVDDEGTMSSWNIATKRLDYTMIGGPRGTWISENHVKKRFWRGDDGSLIAKANKDAAPQSVTPSGMAAKDTLVITTSRKELEVPEAGGKVRITVKNRGRNPSFWIQVRQRKSGNKSTPVTLLPNKLTRLAAGRTEVMEVQFITHDLDFLKTNNRVKLQLELVTKAGSTFPINVDVKLVKNKLLQTQPARDEKGEGRNKQK